MEGYYIQLIIKRADFLQPCILSRKENLLKYLFFINKYHYNGFFILSSQVLSTCIVSFFAFQTFQINNNINLNSMSSQADIRQRQSKRKIFLEDSYKSRLQERSVDNGIASRKIYPEPHSSRLDQQNKRQIQQLKHSVKELKTQLQLQREKYDQLFEEYEELIEKNNLIEKEYINLKYEHNKEVKNLKKSYKDKVEEEIRINVQDFVNKMNGQNILESMKQKIDKFVSNLRRISEIFMQKSKKHHSHDTNTTDVLAKLKNSYKVDPIKLQQKIQKTQINEREQKVVLSPNKQNFKQNEIMVNSSFTNKQILFEDQYYGDLDDYEQYEQKIIQRKNYQLMKNCNRSSSEVRRKKIFNKSTQFQ